MCAMVMSVLSKRSETMALSLTQIRLTLCAWPLIGAGSCRTAKGGMQTARTHALSCSPLKRGRKRCGQLQPPWAQEYISNPKGSSEYALGIDILGVRNIW